MKKNLMFCYILAAVITASATDYCDAKCVFNGAEITHIRCGDDGGFGPKCPKTAEAVTMTESRKNLFLHEFNVLRNFVAGGGNSSYEYSPACRMGTLQWHDELAFNAGLNTNKCEKKYDFCHITDTIKRSGQAIHELIHFANGTIDEVVKETVGEWKILTLKPGFSDIIVDRNAYVGCAITRAPFPKPTNANYYVICNFGTDIQKGELLYDECKSPAEKCENKPVDPYPNLCAVGEAYE